MQFSEGNLHGLFTVAINVQLNENNQRHGPLKSSLLLPRCPKRQWRQDLTGQVQSHNGINSILKHDDELCGKKIHLKKKKLWCVYWYDSPIWGTLFLEESNCQWRNIKNIIIGQVSWGHPGGGREGKVWELSDAYQHDCLLQCAEHHLLSTVVSLWGINNFCFSD